MKNRRDAAPDIVIPAHGDQPPVIRGPYGPTDESMRRQAAENLRDPTKFEEFVRVMKPRHGSRKKVIDWMRRAYPETFEKRENEEDVKQ